MAIAGWASCSSCDRFRLVRVALAITLTRRCGLPATPLEVGDPGDQNEERSNRPQDRGRPGIGLEEGGRDDVLDLRRSRQRVHREGEGAESDGARDEPLGDAALPEHLGREWIDRKHHHKERHAPVGQKSAHQHDREHGALAPDEANDGRDDGLREPGQLDHFAEHRAEQEDRKVQLHEADHLVHEHAGEDRRHGRGVGQEHGEHRRDRREEDHAEAAIGDKHQEHEGSDGDQKTHESLLFA